MHGHFIRLCFVSTSASLPCDVGWHWLTSSKSRRPVCPLGGAISNMYAMLLARFKMFPEVKEKGMSSVPRLVAFTSEHVSIYASVQLILISTTYRTPIASRCVMLWAKSHQITQTCWVCFEFSLSLCFFNLPEPFFNQKRCSSSRHWDWKCDLHQSWRKVMSASHPKCFKWKAN